MSFFVYLFFTFFGTSFPFQERAKEIEEIGTSNIVNQVVFSALFLLSSCSLVTKKNELISLIKREKYLFLILAWSFLSIFWSNYSFVSFKRWFQIVTSVTVISAFFLHSREPDDSLAYLKSLLYAYIVLTYVSILVIPGAIDPVHHTWRGLTVGKNYLGQVAVVSIVIWSYAFKKDPFNLKFVDVFMVVLSFSLLIGAKSMTSIVTFLILLFLFAIARIDRALSSLRIGKFFLFVSIFGCLTLLIIVFFLGFTAIIIPAFESIGKDITFTGRTDLWIDLIRLAKEHLILGYGIGGFWVLDPYNVDLFNLYDEYVWLPNEAHCGYLDIFIQLGIVGLLIFVLMLASYFRNLVKTGRAPFGFWLMVAALILNLQESTFLFPRVLTGEIFLFAYLSLYSQLIQQSTSGTVSINYGK